VKWGRGNKKKYGRGVRDGPSLYFLSELGILRLILKTQSFTSGTVHRKGNMYWKRPALFFAVALLGSLPSPLFRQLA
jgi:hypothetical protein